MIRRLVAADLEALVALWVDAWNATLPAIDFAARADWLRERLAAHVQVGIAILCAAEGDDPVGFVTVDPRDGHVDQLAVRLDRQGSGTATALIEAAASIAGPLCLEVNQENPRAVRFYLREGFVVTGEGTIGANHRPTLLMRRPGQARPEMLRAARSPEGSRSP